VRPKDQYAEVEPAVVLAEAWDVQAPSAVWIDDRSFTGKAIARLDAATGPLCLRRLPPGTSPAWLEATHAAVAVLERRGFDLFPHVLPTDLGETVVRHSGQHYDLASWAPGEVLGGEDLSSEHLTNLGAAIARLHRAGAGATGRGVPSAPRFDWLNERQRLTQRLAWDPLARGKNPWQKVENLAAFFDGLDAGRLGESDGTSQLAWDARGVEDVALAALRWLDRVGSSIAELSSDSPTLTHGDLWSDHVRFSGSNVTALLDPDTLAVRPPLGDLAALCADFGQWDAARCAAILAGYRRHRPVRRAAVAALPRLGALRTLGVLRERLQEWLAAVGRGEPGAALRGPIGYWCGQLRTLSTIEPAEFGALAV